MHLKTKLLWSPVHSGPITIRKQVVTVHDLVPLDNPEWLTPGFVAWYRFMLPKLLKKSRHLIAISEFTKSRIIQRLHIPPEKISVVYNGVEQRFTPHAEETSSKVRETLGLPSGHYVLALGSLEPRKNISRLLQAWAQILPDIPQKTWLVIAGGAGQTSVFRSVDYSQSPERVIWAGHVPDEDLPGLYAGALLFVYPSMYEGFGLPALESMACGCPVICSNTGALPEVCGDAAMFINPLSSHELARALRQLITSRSSQEQLKLSGIQQSKKFYWQKTAQQTLNILKNFSFP